MRNTTKAACTLLIGAALMTQAGCDLMDLAGGFTGSSPSAGSSLGGYAPSYPTSSLDTSAWYTPTYTTPTYTYDTYDTYVYEDVAYEEVWYEEVWYEETWEIWY